ncbi:hypothetical protein Bpfe_018018, partial [Biomphalaria pfeifferi]
FLLDDISGAAQAGDAPVDSLDPPSLSPQMTSGNMSRHESPAIDGNVTSFDREYLHWSFIIIEVAAIVVIVIGDISMLMMFFTRKLLGQSTNILVFSVGIGDLVTGLLALPLAMMQK